MSTIRPIEILSPDEVEQLLGAAGLRSPSGVRIRALIAVLYWAGLRLDEALALEQRDVDLTAGRLNVRRGKGGRQRIAGLNASAVAHLDRWFGVRRQLGIRKALIFCTYSKSSGERRVRPLSARSVQAALKRLAVRAGIEKRVHPHGLRHAHAVGLLERGLSVYDIQQQLGHADLGTTAVYLQGLAGEHAARVARLEWTDPPENS